ncbi:hypothetical protein Q5424_02715 [Conexibacter sp. JD483]|uniref:hypothetical protein n=1 Tax=unclassified Conexibacter TaxID=2627773 RepID=UPI0027285A36|nr:MULTISPECIES: hypothetical protein [unclassified Conexibacter]MDO8184067.1 hypothetical protein [Conexibacter sp. CPCC 205706]MDO8197059.1 hypothetical protein [Conexibacter sp. CPCC 205762]MDR9367975.1 hypothetical protein [Conexibacter sp. JD483]
MRDGLTPRRALLTVLLALVLLLIAFCVELLPRMLRQERVIASTPVPTGSRQQTALEIGPDQRYCQEGIVFAPEGERLLLSLTQDSPLPTELTVTLRAPGYRQRVVVRPEGHQIGVPLDPPSKTVTGRLCVGNTGTTATQLAATDDPRVLARTKAVPWGGYPLAIAFDVTFTSADEKSMLQSLGTTADRAATFNALGPWALWLLLPLIGLGVPALLLGGWYLALRAPGDGPGDRPGAASDERSR